MRKILVLRGGALGDFLVTIPALNLLRAQWPEARIELVGNLTAAALGIRAGLLDAVYSQHESRWGALFTGEPLPAELRQLLADFDLVLNYWPDPDGTLGRHFPLHRNQHYLVAPALPGPEAGPAAAHYCAPLRKLGLLGQNYAPLLAETAFAQPWCALHPGSGSPVKNWPLDRWTDLAGRLRQGRRLELFIISGDAEPADILAGRGQSWRCLPLTTLLGRLAQCRLFIGHDSGVSHLAAAAGIPCLLLFGPTDPAVWAPPHQKVKIIRQGPTMSHISVAQAYVVAAALLQDPK